MAKPPLFDEPGSPHSAIASSTLASASARGSSAAAGPVTGEIARFGVVGLANVGVDLSVYVGLLSIGAMVPVAKAVAFLFGTAFSYFANKAWTFRNASGSASKFAATLALYAVSMAVNVAINSGVINVLGDGVVVKGVAYCCAVLTSASINFVGMRTILTHAPMQRGRAG